MATAIQSENDLLKEYGLTPTETISENESRSSVQSEDDLLKEYGLTSDAIIPVPQNVLDPNYQEKTLEQQIKEQREAKARQLAVEEEAMQKGATLEEARLAGQQQVPEAASLTRELEETYKKVEDPEETFAKETDIPTLQLEEQERGRRLLTEVTTDPIKAATNVVGTTADTLNALTAGNIVFDSIRNLGKQGDVLVSDLLKDLKNKFPAQSEAIEEAIQKYKDKKLPATSWEGAVAGIVPALIGGTAGFKIADKLLQPVEKTKVLSKGMRAAKVISGGGTGAVVADVLTRDDDELILKDIIAELPEVAKAVETGDLTDFNIFEKGVLKYLNIVEKFTPKEVVDYYKELSINPDDPDLLKRGKQIVDALGGAVVSGPINATFILGSILKASVSKGLAKIRGKRKAIQEGEVTKETPASENAAVISTEVIEEVPDAGLQRMLNRTDINKKGDDAIVTKILQKEDEVVPTETGAVNKRLPVDESPRVGLERAVKADEIESEYSQRSVVKEIIGKVNTSLGKHLSTDLPKEIKAYFNKYKQTQKGRDTRATAFKKKTRDLINKVKAESKKENVDKDDLLADINYYGQASLLPRTYDEKSFLEFLDTPLGKAAFNKVSQNLSSDYTLPSLHRTMLDEVDNSAAKLPATIVDDIDEMNSLVFANEKNINDQLGLSGKGQLGFGFKQDGEIYLTRSFLAVDNPKYLKEIQKYLKGDEVTTETRVAVDNSRQDFSQSIFKRRYENLDSDQKAQIDGIVRDAIAHLNRKRAGDFSVSELFDTIGNTKGIAGLGEKVLRGRKDLSPALRNLFKEDINYLSRLETSLVNQSRVMGALDLVSDLKTFTKNNLDKEFNMGGLFKSLLNRNFARQARITKGGSREEKDRLQTFASYNDIKGMPNAFKQIEKRVLGSLGGQNRVSELDKLAISKEFGDSIINALDSQAFNTSNYLFEMFRKLTGIGQMSQTVLDHGAYLINTLGGIQSMVANAYVFEPAMYKAAIGSTVRLFQGLKNRDSKTLNYFAKLREQGVLDTDPIAENTMDLVRLSEDPRKLGTMADRAAVRINKGSQTLGEAYGSIDNYFKTLAHQSEMARTKRAYPFKYVKQQEGYKNLSASEARKKYDDFVFKNASDEVKAKMYNYGEVGQTIKGISRTPFIGNFVLFPAETIRVYPNMARIYSKNMLQGMGIILDEFGNRRVNPYLAATGLVGIGSLLGSTKGVDVAIDYKNSKLENDFGETVGVPKENTRALDLSGRGFNSDYKRVHMQAPQQQADGRIIGKYVASTLFDQPTLVKNLIKEITALALDGKEMPDVELSTKLQSIWNSGPSQFTSPTFLTGAIIQSVFDKNLNGDPSFLYKNTDSIWEKISTGLLNVVEKIAPDGVKKTRDYLDALDAEEVADIVNKTAVNSYGYPVDSGDIEFWAYTGMKPRTYDYGKTVASDMFKTIRSLTDTVSDFKKEIDSIKPQPYNEDLQNKIVNEYRKLQKYKLDKMKELAEKAHIYSQFQYTDSDGKTKTEEGNPITFGQDRIIEELMLYNKVFSPRMLPLELYLAQESIKNLQGGTFIPDYPETDTSFIESLTRKNIPTDKLLQALANVRKEFEGQSLFPVKQGEE